MSKYILTLVLVLSNIAYADNITNIVMNKYDMDKDGTIDAIDVKNYTKKYFSQMDTNKNNLADISEFYTKVCKESCDIGNCECNSKTKRIIYIDDYFHKLDKNKDLNVDINEILNDNIKIFKSLDANNDNQINQMDMESYY